MLDLVNSIEIKSNAGALSFVTLHLLTQNEKSQCEGSCYYRSQDVIYYGVDEDDTSGYEFSGKACAAGALIKDNEYNDDFENEPASDPQVIEAIKKSHPSWNFDENSVTMILVLQKIHDSHDPYEWPLLLKMFTQECNSKDFIFKDSPEGIMEKVESMSYKYLKDNAKGLVAIESNNLREKMLMGGN